MTKKRHYKMPSPESKSGRNRRGPRPQRGERDKSKRDIYKVRNAGQGQSKSVERTRTSEMATPSHFVISVGQLQDGPGFSPHWQKERKIIKNTRPGIYIGAITNI